MKSYDKSFIFSFPAVVPSEAAKKKLVHELIETYFCIASTVFFVIDELSVENHGAEMQSVGFVRSYEKIYKCFIFSQFLPRYLLPFEFSVHSGSCSQI